MQRHSTAPQNDIGSPERHWVTRRGYNKGRRGTCRDEKAVVCTLLTVEGNAEPAQGAGQGGREERGPKPPGRCQPGTPLVACTAESIGSHKNLSSSSSDRAELARVAEFLVVDARANLLAQGLEGWFAALPLHKLRAAAS